MDIDRVARNTVGQYSCPVFTPIETPDVFGVCNNADFLGHLLFELYLLTENKRKA